MKSRKPFTCGKPARSTPRPAPPVWIAKRRDGKTMIGAKSWGLRMVCLTERAPKAPMTRKLVTGWRRSRGSRGSPCRHVCARTRRPRRRSRGVAGFTFQVVAGLREEDVVEGRLHEIERLDLQPRLVQGPDDRRHGAGATLELDQHR